LPSYLGPRTARIKRPRGPPLHNARHGNQIKLNAYGAVA
jgi:hypothetical protein